MVGVSCTFSTIRVSVMLLQSVLIGVLGDFHFQALRICTQEQKLLHGYYMYEVTVQPAGGTCSLDPNAGLGVSAVAVVQLMLSGGPIPLTRGCRDVRWS